MVKTTDRDLILEGFTNSERDLIIKGTTHDERETAVIIRGKAGSNTSRDFILDGTDLLERSGITEGRPLIEAEAIIRGELPVDTRVAYRFKEKELDGFTITGTLSEIVNTLTVLFGYNHYLGRYTRAITKKNPASEAMYGASQKTIELPMVQDPLTAGRIASDSLKAMSWPSLRASFSHDLRSAFLETGDIATLTHSAGIGMSGWVDREARIIRKVISLPRINYTVQIPLYDQADDSSFSRIEFVSQVETIYAITEGGLSIGGGITISYEEGIATFTVYADVSGSPPIEGARLEINGVVKFTDQNGQARFLLDPGTYTAYVSAAGYQSAQFSFVL